MNINQPRSFGVEVIGFDCASADIDHATLAHYIARDEGIAVKSLVGEQGTKLDARDHRLYANRIETVPRQQHEVDKITQRIGQRENLGGHVALGAAYGLILSPPFAPCP